MTANAPPQLNAALSGRYTIERTLGVGGMATVYLAHDIRHDRKVALKVLKADVGAVLGAERFLSEIRVTANLQHPNILPLFDSGAADTLLFYVMPFVDGESLRQRLDREGKLPVDEAVRLAIAVAGALDYAHQHGVIHRDLKPENILLQHGQPVVADFGIALSLSATAGTRLTEVGISLGTPAYMSPEQATGETEIDARSDLYALACVVYEMMCGHPPFTGASSRAIIAKAITELPQPITGQRERVPAHVDAAVLRALEKEPANRFASVREFASALQDPSLDWFEKAKPERRPGASRSRWQAAAAPIIVLVLVVGVWLVSLTTATRTDPAPATPALSILIGGIVNRTGDTTFDAVLPELLATTLEQSRALSVYPRANLGFVLRRMQRAPNTSIDETVGREIAEREGLAAVVLQSITKLGSSYVLVVRAVRPDGQLMASTQQPIAELAQLPGRVDSIGAALRKAFGESAEALAKASLPLEQVTSRSLDAVRLYSQGRQRMYAGDPRSAIDLFRQAVAIDPQFAMAHGALGVAYTNVLDHANAAEQLRIAASLASRAPDLEREKILGDFAMSRRDFVAACPHYVALTAARPRDVSAHLNLGWCSAWQLDFATALAETEKAYELQPSPRTQMNRAMVAFLSGDLKKALENAEAVRAQVPGLMQASFLVGKTLMARADLPAARALYERMVRAGGDMAIEGHNGLADVARSSGKLDVARTHLESARSSATARGNLAIAANATAELAELALAQRQPDRFRAVMATMKASSDPWIVYRTGRTWARAGDSAKAAAAVKAIEALSIGPSRQHDALKALIRAEIALAASNAAVAVAEGAKAVQLEASTVAHETLARAYLAAGRNADAAASFQHVVDRPHERCESYDAPACYRAVEATYWLGRLKDDAGDKAGAAPLLQRFLSTWSGAAGQPMFDDATRRLRGARGARGGP